MQQGHQLDVLQIERRELAWLPIRWRRLLLELSGLSRMEELGATLHQLQPLAPQLGDAALVAQQRLQSRGAQQSDQLGPLQGDLLLQRRRLVAQLAAAVAPNPKHGT